ncbi:MAG: cyclic pyranopterin monophosphate synthase MoaC [Anaerolineales bacterium]|uniref:cyclic pyranopterin monophosphate synthase MoaC n=1 Tax=Candidatus Villigracilis proximus TaxID=3140683 RepID=UPI0031370F19|nr:cyclic pyranopterin monophosphate synthase MoaC [Anaerolineales bacterium]
MSKLTHLDEQGRAHMVDVGAKPDTERTAVARGEIHMKQETFELIRDGQIKKGDVLTVAQIAGISASKRTSELIPLCHPLFLSKVDVDLVLDESLPGVVITATAKVTGKTGVEMEALTAVSVAALTVYDMAKAAEKTMRIQNIRLLEKHGGQSGDVVNE